MNLNWVMAMTLTFIGSAVSAATPSEGFFAFEFSKDEIVCLGKSPKQNTHVCSRTIDIESLDFATTQVLARSDEMVPIFVQEMKNFQYLVFIARIPSRRNQAMGYCGTGHEDHLILLRYDGKQVTLRDDFLLQSCLKSVVLDNDEDGILKALAIDQESHTIKFRWLTHPDDKEHRISLVDEKFLLQ